MLLPFVAMVQPHFTHDHLISQLAICSHCETKVSPNWSLCCLLHKILTLWFLRSSFDTPFNIEDYIIVAIVLGNSHDVTAHVTRNRRYIDASICIITNETRTSRTVMCGSTETQKNVTNHRGQSQSNNLALNGHVPYAPYCRIESPT